MKQRTEAFYKEYWQRYKRPLTPTLKQTVREYDRFLTSKELIIDTMKQDAPKKTQIIHPTPYPPNPTKNPLFAKPKRVAVIHEDVGHMTGGRYYTYFIISALLELGHEVTVYTNREPVFSDEFAKYKKPEIKIASKNGSGLADLKDVRADVYVGSPIAGATAASILGNKFEKPAFALIFDPFPMMEKYLGRKRYVGWRRLLVSLRRHNTHIISLCNATSEYIYPWLRKEQGQVHPVYPCINSKVLDSKKREYERENYVLFISRLVQHKHFAHVVKAVKKIPGLKLKVISSVNAVRASKIVNDHKMKDRVDFHLKVSDDEKFDMIAKSKAVINGSVFEGFGMFVSEAIALGTPFVGYEYPTFREQEEYAKVDNIYLAKIKDYNDLSLKLNQALKEAKFQKPSKLFHFEEMVERLGGI